MEPWTVQVVAVQPQTLEVPLPPQIWGLAQLPQLRVPPQPSETLPQVLPKAAQVVGVQAPVPQTLEVPPPPQVCGLGHEPQLRVPPQPSDALPQF